MSLIDLVDNDHTDKNVIHSYLGLYETLLSNRKTSAKNVLEIGIGPPISFFGNITMKNGGSIKLWRDYFTNAIVYAIDIIPSQDVWDQIQNDPRIKLYTTTDGYNINFINDAFIKNNIMLDMALDDGPHTLDSMIQFIKLYTPILSNNGILIIEDVQSMDWITNLKEAVPDNLKKHISIYDLRHIKDRYDDIVFVIDKNK